MTLRIYMPRTSGEAFESALRAEVGPEVELLFGEKRPDPAAYEVLVAGRPREEDLDASEALHTVIIPWAGLPPVTRDLLRARPHLALHNLHHNAPATAEMAVGLLLAAARGIVPADQALRRGDWRRRYDTDQGLRLVGRTAVVWGYGEIGRRVGRALEAFDMRVHGLRRGDGAEALDALLPEADVLIVSVPSTDETRGAIDAARLARLPRGAIVVNVARGDVIDEEALYEALSSGHLGGAGLDVWYRYPDSEEARALTLPADRPFHELESVVLSPHRAGHGRGTEAARAGELARLLGAAARGEAIPYPVDLDRGY